MGIHENRSVSNTVEAAADVGLKLKLQQALKDAVAILGEEVGVDMDDEAQLVKVVQSCIGTKFISRWADLAVKIAIDAVKKVTVMGEEGGSGVKEIDTKHYAKIEKIPGGTMDETDRSEQVRKSKCNRNLIKYIFWDPGS